VPPLPSHTLTTTFSFPFPKTFYRGSIPPTPPLPIPFPLPNAKPSKPHLIGSVAHEVQGSCLLLPSALLFFSPLSHSLSSVPQPQNSSRSVCPHTSILRLQHLRFLLSDISVSYCSLTTTLLKHSHVPHLHAVSPCGATTMWRNLVHRRLVVCTPTVLSLTHTHTNIHTRYHTHAHIVSSSRGLVSPALRKGQ
jgi:hypothetical protein